MTHGRIAERTDGPLRRLGSAERLGHAAHSATGLR